MTFKYKLTATLLSAAAGLAMTACSKTSSDNVKTSGIYASYRISGNNANQATCSATFQVGGVTGTYLDLDAGDTVTCNGQSMARSEFAGIVTYSATVTYTVGATYTVVFTRTGEAARSSTVMLPKAISPTSPVNGANITKGTAASASWASSTDLSTAMDVTLSYTAGSDSYSYTIPDAAPENGTVGWSTAQTQVTPAVSGTWSGTMRFTRSKSGTMAADLDGTITATQQTQIGVNLVD